MRQIENLELNGDNWKYTDQGITNFLTNAGHGISDGKRYTWKTPNGIENEYFAIMADGNLLIQNEVSFHYILHRIGANDKYIISADEFRNKMQLVQEN
jgi:hypothetical protein